MTKFRGKVGCLRQAAVDAKLDKKIRITGSNVFNEKYDENTRRFDWDHCVTERLTNKELKKFKDAVTPLLAEYDLTVTKVTICEGFVFTAGNIQVYAAGNIQVYAAGNIQLYADVGSNSKVDNLRKKAKKLGYRLIKM